MSLLRQYCEKNVNIMSIKKIILTYYMEGGNLKVNGQLRDKHVLKRNIFEFSKGWFYNTFFKEV